MTSAETEGQAQQQNSPEVSAESNAGVPVDHSAGAQTPSTEPAPAPVDAPSSAETGTATAQADPSDAGTASAPSAADGKPSSDRPRNRGKRKGASKPKSVTEQLHKGKVVEVADGQVRVEFGPKVFGAIAVTEFENPPEVGAEHQFGWQSVGADGVWQLDRSHEKTQELWKKLEVGVRIEALVVGQNSGGLELRVGSVAAFLPASQVDVSPVKDLQAFQGQKLECEILEVNRKRRRVVVSRRAILSRELDAARAVAVKSLSVGEVREGKVERLEGFGAIVDLGEGLSGLIHVSNLSHQRVRHPKDVLKVGESVRVQILEIKDGGKRIGLGRKQLETDPWSEVASRCRVGSRHAGKVVRTTDFGAFVSLGDGVEGLVHISQLSKDRVERVTDVVKEGEEIQVRVVNLDPDRRRVGLSRLNRSGEMIGSDNDNEEGDEAEVAAIEQFKQPPTQRGTNLGDVLRKALEGRS